VTSKSCKIFLFEFLHFLFVFDMSQCVKEKVESGSKLELGLLLS
jgi:hypothetical protein